eukprot:165004-Pelagomonas_calceolata.AAC.5
MRPYRSSMGRRESIMTPNVMLVVDQRAFMSGKRRKTCSPKRAVCARGMFIKRGSEKKGYACQVQLHAVQEKERKKANSALTRHL